MNKTRSILSSIVNYKCPRCRQGDLFTKPFSISDPLSMPQRCAVCNQKTMPEPGFYYGAMFLSYIMSGFLYLGIMAVCMIGLKWSLNGSFALLLAVAALSYFKLARISRSIWIHTIVKFEKGIN